MRIKKLGRRIPGERVIVKSSDPDYDYEEVRTCYDTATYLPRWDNNPDDEDLSDCQDDCLLQNKAYEAWEISEREYKRLHKL